MSSSNFVFFGSISKQKWWQIVLGCTICGPLGLLFNAPELKAQVHYCDHALYVVHSSVVIFFSHFQLLWNRWSEFNETWEEARSKSHLLSLCFGADWKKMTALTSDWLRHFRLFFWKPVNGIQQNLTGSKIWTSSIKFVFFGPIGGTRWPPLPLIGWDIFDFSEIFEGNLTKLDRKQDLNVLYQVCVFGAEQKKKKKNKMTTMSADWLRQFDFSSETTERNSTKLDRKQDLNVLY